MSEVTAQVFDSVREVLAAGRAQDYHVQVRRRAGDIDALRTAAERVSMRIPGVELSPYMNRAIRAMTPERVREAA